MELGKTFDTLLTIITYPLFVSNVLAKYDLVNRPLSSLPFRLNNLALSLIAIGCFLAHGYLNSKVGGQTISPPSAADSCNHPFLEVPRVITFIGLWLALISLGTPMLKYLENQLIFQKPWITNVCFGAGFIYPGIYVLAALGTFYNSENKSDHILDAAHCIPQILAPSVPGCSFFSITTGPT